MNWQTGVWAGVGALGGGILGLFGAIVVTQIAVSPYPASDKAVGRAGSIGAVVGVAAGAFLGAALAAPEQKQLGA